MTRITSSSFTLIFALLLASLVVVQVHTIPLHGLEVRNRPSRTVPFVSASNPTDPLKPTVTPASLKPRAGVGAAVGKIVGKFKNLNPFKKKTRPPPPNRVSAVAPSLTVAIPNDHTLPTREIIAPGFGPDPDAAARDHEAVPQPDLPFKAAPNPDPVPPVKTTSNKANQVLGI